MARDACVGSPMHAQAERSDQRHGHRDIPFVVATGPVLYLATFAGEVLSGAALRWLLTYLGVSALGLAVSLGPSAGTLAWFAALAPLLRSALALFLPSRGRAWGRRLGARAPSADERAQIDDALALLRGADPNLRGASAYHVLDDPHPEAAARGDAVMLTRGLLDTDGLAAVLAHELGHVVSLDARLTEALDRLVLWDDPLAPPEDPEEPREGGLLHGVVRLTLRLTGGGFAQRLLAPAWAAHWRAREYAADQYAASLGQAEDLARHLFEQLLPFDAPQRRLLFNRAEHPPVAHRIERLLDGPGGIEFGPDPVFESMPKEER